MRLEGQPLPGMLVLARQPRADARGYFARCFCRETLARFGVDREVAQANLSWTERRGTLRGLHYQSGPSAETKVVMCLTGAIHDVVLDLRPDSPAFRQHEAIELTPGNGRIVVVPEGCAHGFQALTDDTLVLYLVSARHDPAREHGIRWNDPAFGIPWPLPPSLISARDAGHPDFDLGRAAAC